jgi:hypothetical protein
MAEDIRNMASTAGKKEFEKKYAKPYCIVLDSEYCSMGRMIGMIACRETGYTYYDAMILLEENPQTGITLAEVEAFEKGYRSKELSKEELCSDPEYQRIDAAFDQAIDAALAKGPCLIHDRAVKEMIEAKGYSCISVLTYADNMEAKIARAKLSPLYKDLDAEEIPAKIQEEDNIRINYHKAHSQTAWGDKQTYDLLINAETFGRDQAAVILESVMR